MEEIETLVSMESNFEEDPLEKALGFIPLEDEESEENMVLVEANLRNFIQSTRFELLELEVREFVQPKLSIEEPPTLELKVLPSHLKYVYLGDCSTLPMIISAELKKDQEEQLIAILKKFKKVIR